MAKRVERSEETREANLLDYWRTIWRGRWTVLGVFIVVVGLVAVGTFTQTPVYRATAKVEITPQSGKISPVADVAEPGSGGYGWFAEERYFNTQYEIIKSRDVARRVFEQLDLYNHPMFAEAKDPVGAFSKMIEVTPVKDTGLVEISLEGANPEEITVWVNTVAQEYVQRNLDQAVQTTSKAVKALLQEITPLRAKLEDSQAKSFEFAEKANLYVPENQQKITDERLSTLQTQLTDTQVKRASLESLLSQVGDGAGDGGQYAKLIELSDDAMMQSLYKQKVDLEREYERLLVTYKPRHTLVLEKKSEIDNVTAKLGSEATRVVNNLRAQVDLLKDQERKLSKAIEDTRAESLRVNERASSYDLVRGEAAETRRIYDLINTRIKEIDLSSSLMNNNLRILDEAAIPKFSVKPRVVLNMAVGVLLGLGLGVGLVFFVDYLDNTVRTSDDVEKYLHLNLLAVVPKEGPETERAVREAYQTLRTSLLFSRKSRSANAVLVTSAGPQEGKSCTTVNLAKVLARSGERVIVLDCDLRRPAIHSRLGVSREEGVTNLILSAAGEDWRAFVKPTDDANLYAMACGPLPPNPADVFGHERFQATLKELRTHFDWVFLDSPPIVSLADAVILSSLVDMVMIVIKHNENDRDLIRRCVGNLEKVDANVIGAVLNHVDLDKSLYRDYYYVGYYYYGEHDPKGRRKRSSSADLKLTGAGEGGDHRSVG